MRFPRPEPHPLLNPNCEGRLKIKLTDRIMPLAEIRGNSAKNRGAKFRRVALALLTSSKYAWRVTQYGFRKGGGSGEENLKGQSSLGFSSPGVHPSSNQIYNPRPNSRARSRPSVSLISPAS